MWKSPPVLLTMPDYCGTLAAARCLGSYDVPVWMSGASLASPAMHSRHVKRRLLSPAYTTDGAAWIEWLLQVGRDHPGLVLYPTTDDLAWFMALHADELGRHFQTWAPKVDVYERLLDKSTLHAAAVKVGLATPFTLAPVTDDELERAAVEMPLPALIKQRTQVMSLTNDKGELVHDRRRLKRAFEAFRARNRHGPQALARMPNASSPLMQQYFAEGVSGILEVSGFIDETGELFVARAATKLLQWPRTLGISLCLEATPLDPVLAEKVRALCKEVGYFGVFDVEFLQVKGQPMLIDFNPRYYHFMALDIARGMPLPLMTTVAACGQRTQLEALVEQARTARYRASGFTYSMQLNELLVAQTLTATMSWAESRKWRGWVKQHEGGLVDAVKDEDDPRPYFVDLATSVASKVRRPGRFIRRVALDRT